MSSLPPIGTIIGGRYRLDDLRGQGGMGAVFGATNIATGRAVAIKWLLPDASRSAENIQRFLIEARAAGAVDHPNVIGIIDVGQDSGAPFLVMELLRGEPLSSALARARLPWTDALDVLIPCCLGVAQAHAAGIVHRDIKPANIFLVYGKDGRMHGPKVLDFGVAKFFEAQTPSITETGVSMGTPNYMCPQQIENPRAVDPSWDVYAMGIVLYETLTGRRPYDAIGLSDLVNQIFAASPPPIRSIAPDVPPELADVVMRAFHPRADHRHASMRELAADLSRFRGQSMPVSTPSAPAAPVAPSRGLGLGLMIGCAAAAGLGVAALGALAVFFYREWPREGRDPAPEISGAPAEPRDPTAPRVELTYDGCHPDFGASLRISTVQDSIHIDSFSNGAPVAGLYVLPNGTPMEGAVRLPNGLPQIGSRPYIALTTGPGNWTSIRSNPRSGQLVVRQWDRANGIVDVTFNNARVEQSPTEECIINGRLQTFGRTTPPNVALTFAGCSASFPNAQVEPWNDQIAIVSGQTRLTFYPEGARMEGPVPLYDSGDWLVMIHMPIGRDFYSTNPPEPGAGWLEIARWDGGTAEMDIVFHDVVVRHPSTGARCTLNGRVRTFGRREAT